MLNGLEVKALNTVILLPPAKFSVAMFTQVMLLPTIVGIVTALLATINASSNEFSDGMKSGVKLNEVLVVASIKVPSPMNDIPCEILARMANLLNSVTDSGSKQA